MTAHWGVQDPAALQGSDEDERRAFLGAYTELHRRISLFINLPFDTLSKLSLEESLTRSAVRNDVRSGRGRERDRRALRLRSWSDPGSSRRFAQLNADIALLANSIPMGAGLYALIVILAPISGAHFHPWVSGLSVWEGTPIGTRWRPVSRGGATQRSFRRVLWERMRCSEYRRSFRSQRIFDRP